MKDYPRGAIRTTNLLLNLQIGDKIYCTVKLPETSYVEEYTILEKLYCENTMIRGLNTTISYRDHNIPKLNGYNYHFLFLKKEDAEAYRDTEIFTNEDRKRRREFLMEYLMDAEEYLEQDGG